MRCFALGQAWRNAGGRIVFVTMATNQWLRRRLSEEGLEIRALSQPYPAADDWRATLGTAAIQPNPWVVLDGYHFDAEYQRRIKEAGFKLAVIDDIAALSHYCADMLINQNVYAEDLAYSCESYTRRLLGTRYAMLREEFAVYRGLSRAVGAQARRILIMMGGSDPQNATVKVLTALQEAQLPALEVRVLVGAANPRLKEIRATASRLCFPAESRGSDHAGSRTHGLGRSGDRGRGHQRYRTRLHGCARASDGSGRKPSSNRREARRTWRGAGSWLGVADSCRANSAGIVRLDRRTANPRGDGRAGPPPG